VNTFITSKNSIVTSPILAPALYACLIAALLFIAFSSISDVVDRHAQVAAATNMLEQLDGRRAPAAHSGDVTVPTGSPYLEGATVTVAGANLLQRVAGAVVKLGGNVLSTQLDVQGAPSRGGLLSMIASCEIEQSQLQKLLYDLEAGMPFLFVDQLEVQAPLNNSDAGSGKLRILIAVSGQWRGTK
jgi:general secretion pathway protein M